MTEKVINNYQITNNITAQTVNIIGNSNDFETKGHNLVIYKGNSEIVEIPSYINTISSSAFIDNKTIKKVILNNVYIIEDSAFSDCSNLEEIVFNKGVYIHNGAFLNCISLKKVVIPSGTSWIMPNAFCGCKSLEYVEIASSVDWIGQRAFSNCISLKSVKFHSNSTRIYENTFQGCSMLDTTGMSFKYIVKNNTTAQSGCYVATCVYGSYDCPEVWTLRRFRDYILATTWHGRLFIKCYYAISPTIVKWFGNTKWFKSFWKVRLDKMVSNLRQQGIEDKPYNDRH